MFRQQTHLFLGDLRDITQVRLYAQIILRKLCLGGLNNIQPLQAFGKINSIEF